MDFRSWCSRKLENITIWVAQHLPRSLRKWVVVMAAVRACGDTGSPSNITYPEIYKAA